MSASPAPHGARLLALVAIAMLAGLAACASTVPNLQRESARVIGGGIAPADVQISDVQRGMMTVDWTATTADGRYDCTADDMVRRPLCTKGE